MTPSERAREIVTKWLCTERNGDASEHPGDHELINDVAMALTIPTGHAAAHELDNIAVECGMGHSPASGDVAKHVRTLTRQVKVLREALTKKCEVTPHAHGSGKWRLYGHRPEYVCVFKNEQEARRVCELLNQELESLAALASEGAER